MDKEKASGKPVSKKIKLRYKVKMVEKVIYLCPECGNEMYEDEGLGRYEPAFACSNEKCGFDIPYIELEHYELRS